MSPLHVRSATPPGKTSVPIRFTNIQIGVFIVAFVLLHSAHAGNHASATWNTYPFIERISPPNASSVSKAFHSTQVCAPGFGFLAGDSTCARCPPGFYSKGGLGSKCTVCDQFSYATSSGSSSCTACPSNQWVGSKGSSQPVCVCLKNFYFAFYKEASLKHQTRPTPAEISVTLSSFSAPVESFCLSCPEGASCPGSLEAPQPKNGFWANQSDPVNIVFCTWNKDACLGGFRCLPKHTGPLCGRCEPDNFMRSGTCSQCSLSARIIILYIILIGIFGGLVFVWLVKVHSTFVIISSVQYFQVLTILNRCL
jgi:hypothetical protein